MAFFIRFARDIITMKSIIHDGQGNVLYAPGFITNAISIDINRNYVILS
ncbi:hypothetical protein [Ohtaekwangia koreensis]|nr:hypothetical protein [Ohtaekwangia koreensis]